MTTFLPVSLSADDVAAAGTLQSAGKVLVNQKEVPQTSPLFPDDVIQTQPGSVGRIQLDGSTVEIAPESVVRFERDEIVLEHGGVSVNTLRQYKVRSGCVLVVPAEAVWTFYQVTNTSGKVTAFARKKDVNIDSREKNAHAAESVSSKHATVREGEQQSREEKCGPGYDNRSATPDGILNSPYAVGTGAAIVAAVTLCVLLCFNDEPLSPDSPDGKKR